MGPTTFNNHKAIVGGNDTACDSKQTMRAMWIASKMLV